MAITDEAKAEILRRKIARAQEAQYGHLIDHEIYTLLRNAKRVTKAEEGLRMCGKIIELLAAKLNAVTSHASEFQESQSQKRE